MTKWLKHARLTIARVRAKPKHLHVWTPSMLDLLAPPLEAGDQLDLF